MMIIPEIILSNDLSIDLVVGDDNSSTFGIFLIHLYYGVQVINEMVLVHKYYQQIYQYVEPTNV